MHVPKLYKYEVMNKYPGMRPQDEVLWDSFVMLHPDEFETVYYDYHIGNPATNPAMEKDMRQSGSFDVSQWDIDALALDGTQWYVVEIKPNALAGALGQALAYTALLKTEDAMFKNAQPMVITDTISPITEQAAKLLGVKLIIP